MLKGLLYGAAIGAIAGGVAAAMEERYFPNVLPGYTPKPDKDGKVEPKPPGKTDPTKPAPPKKNCGGYGRHTHDDADFRHSHAGGDRWHYHGCPDNGVQNEDIICFKPSQVPECYEEEKPVQNCDTNGSVCYITKF